MHVLKFEQLLPATRQEVWKYFSNPNNLNNITPQDLVFEILSPLPEEIYAGMFIRYRLRPVLNLPVLWCTEITQVKEGQYFVDEQRVGPYRIWHHEHHFVQTEKGVLMKDIVHYDIGWSLPGWLAGHIFVHKKVNAIFEYRRNAIKAIFG